MFSGLFSLFSFPVRSLGHSLLGFLLFSFFLFCAFGSLPYNCPVSSLVPLGPFQSSSSSAPLLQPPLRLPVLSLLLSVLVISTPPPGFASAILGLGSVIVIDCSARQDRKSNSLNDCLYSGPSLTVKLGKVLLKFRTNPFAFAADISKAFLRVGLQEEDRDYTRFLWPENPLDPESNFITYRFRSVLFGATSSPFVLQATLTHHLNKSESQCAEKLKESLYVDNLQGTMLSEPELIDFHHSVNQTMAEANMPLKSWCTNSPELQKAVSIGQSDEQKLLYLGIT